jgi:hypothetical protein
MAERGGWLRVRPVRINDAASEAPRPAFQVSLGAFRFRESNYESIDDSETARATERTQYDSRANF